MKKKILAFILMFSLLFGALPLFYSSAEDVGGFNGILRAGEDTFDGPVYEADFCEGEVISSADSQEHAEEIAAYYGLELDSYAWGVAVYKTPDPEAAVERSEIMAEAAISPKGFITKRKTPSNIPELELNYIYHIDEDEAPAPEPQAPPMALSAAAPVYAPINPNQWHHAAMDNPRAWEITTGEGVVVAVLDTGVNPNHTDFGGDKLTPNSYDAYRDLIGLEYMFDGYGHGTHVASIIASPFDKGENYYGTAPGARIMAIKINSGSDSSFSSFALARGINYAAENGADVINISGGSAGMITETNIIYVAIKNAYAKGVVIVCAAGNEKSDLPYSPAAVPETISVANTTSSNSLGIWSNFGPYIDIAAPGTDIYAANYGNSGYTFHSGTSMASPNVAGVAALVKSVHPEYTVEQVKQVLFSTARRAGELNNGKDYYFGHGIVNSYAAVLGPDACYNVTYDFNDGHASVTIKAAPGSKLFQPSDFLASTASRKLCSPGRLSPQ